MNLAASKPTLISLDWGTSALRAYLLDPQGHVLDKRSASKGIMQVQDGDFGAVLKETIQDWQVYGPLPILASGMITSRQGWVETSYLPTPTSSLELADALIAIPWEGHAHIYFVGGVMDQTPEHIDVMRGEETQLLGAYLSGMPDGWCILPGTHSKWADIHGGTINQFRTFMTGEVFASLSQHTILKASIAEGDFDEAMYLKGVDRGLNSGPGLLNHLFHIRASSLFGGLTAPQAGNYLSGLLIGHELGGQQLNLKGQEQVCLIGSEGLTQRYATALEHLGFETNLFHPDIVTSGHMAIAQRAGLIS